MTKPKHSNPALALIRTPTPQKASAIRIGDFVRVDFVDPQVGALFANGEVIDLRASEARVYLTGLEERHQALWYPLSDITLIPL